VLFKFILPNIFSLKNIRYVNIPDCQQKILITGKGKVSIGKDCKFGFKQGGFYLKGCIEFQPRDKNAIIKIGKNVVTNNNIFICSLNYIEIGDNTLIGQNVTLMDFEAHGILPKDRREIGVVGEIIIGRNVWIGNNVMVLKGTKIGDNPIVAAGAIVKGVFPSNAIIGGVPGKVIKNI
jgi:acetyltransferase-like isoleucine patch superfamily enzyme